jgi:hypothetical protein
MASDDLTILPGSGCKRETFRIGGNENENNIWWWVLQKLEECPPHLGSEKITSLDNEDLVTGVGGEWGGAHTAQQGSHVLNL